MSTVVEETTPPVECSSRASPVPAGASADRPRNSDSVAASFIRDRVSQQQQQQQIESKAAELVEGSFGKFISSIQLKRINCKQNAKWQHLSQLKASAFFSLKTKNSF
jgi:hypothetical protein